MPSRLVYGNDAGDYILPQIAIDDEGNGVAAWSQQVGGAHSAYVNRYCAAANIWDVAEELDTTVQDAQRVAIAMDAAGNALAAWGQREGTGDTSYGLLWRYSE